MCWCLGKLSERPRSLAGSWDVLLPEFRLRVQHIAHTASKLVFAAEKYAPAAEVAADLRSLQAAISSALNRVRRYNLKVSGRAVLRFIEGSLYIPDELLLALDVCRVAFFCSAGVSCAKANLPDFFVLTDQVLPTLGMPTDASAVKILAKARELEARTGVPSLISSVRVIGLLERDFLEGDIECAVARALDPKKSDGF